MTSIPTRETLLERAALRAADDPWMLASALCVVSTDGSLLDLDAVSAALSCDRERVVALALCRRPNPDSPSFRDDVASIATTNHIDPVRLLNLLREAEALAAFRKASGRQVLAAARDAQPTDKERDSEDD